MKLKLLNTERAAELKECGAGAVLAGVKRGELKAHDVEGVEGCRPSIVIEGGSRFERWKPLRRGRRPGEPR